MGRKSEKNYLHIAFYQMERCLEVDKDFEGLLKRRGYSYGTCTLTFVCAGVNNKRRFTLVGEGESGPRPLPPQTLSIMVGLTLKLLSMHSIFGLDLK